jgi:hypothetical protein
MPASSVYFDTLDEIAYSSEMVIHSQSYTVQSSK